MKNEALMQLQEVLGENTKAEAFRRIITLLENGTISVQASTIDWYRDDFENLTFYLLERLRIASEQIKGMPGDDFAREKFLNLVTDLLRIKMITPQEFETALKKPRESSLPWLFNSLKNEAKELLLTLILPPQKRVA